MNQSEKSHQIFYEQTGVDDQRVVDIVCSTLSHTDDGELYLQYGQGEHFFWDDGKLRSAGFDTNSGFGLRAVKDEAVAYAHASVFNEEELKKASATVSSICKHGSSFALPSTNSVIKSLYPDVNPTLDKSFADKVSLLQTIDSYVRAQEPRVRQVSLSLAGAWKVVEIVRGNGERVSDIRPMVSLHVSVVVANGARMESGVYGFGGRHDYAPLFDIVNWHKAADEALRKACVCLEAVPAPAGEMTVVLGHGWPAVMLHEAIGHGLEADFIRKKTSAFTSLLGQRVAAKGVTVVDDGSLSGLRGSLAVDDEGTSTQCTTLIEDGILVGFMQDRLNARLMGTVSTGNGRRESYACPPIPRMTNTIMRPGLFEKDEIIASVKKGIYAPDFGGGQVDITTGKFVFSATEAYEIIDGKLGRPLKGASLVGTGFDALTRISMVGNDTCLDPGVGTCGKGGQSVPVGIGQPTLRLDGMTVGGIVT